MNALRNYNTFHKNDNVIYRRMKNILLLYTTTLMDLKGMELSKMSQIKTEIQGKISLPCKIIKI